MFLAEGRSLMGKSHWQLPVSRRLRSILTQLRLSSKDPSLCLLTFIMGKKPRSCSSVQSRWQQMSDFYMMDVSINDFLQDLNLIFRGQVLILPFWARGGGTRGRGMPRTALLCVP